MFHFPHRLLTAFFMILAPTFAAAHDDHCAAIAASVADAGFDGEVTVTCTDTHAIISSDTYPDHELMNGIVRTNEQVPVPADYDAPVILEPATGDEPLTRDSSVGVAVNGVPIFDYTSAGEMTEADLANHQARHDTVQNGELDVCGGHAGQGDDYHYHMKPVCMIAQMKNAGDDAIIGWAFDGYPIYGDNNPDGSTISEGDLDICNGQADDTFGYRYHTSAEAPYIVQCLMGQVPDFEDIPRIDYLSAVQNEGGSGRPPRDGVDDLVFTESADGSRSMDYTYEGESYYIRYTPAAEPGCYDFVTRKVTTGGEEITGEYCRD